MTKSAFTSAFAFDPKSFPSPTAPNDFSHLQIDGKDLVLNSTSISITEAELLHAKRFLALIAITGGQNCTKVDGSKITQKDVYLKQGILSDSLPEVSGVSIEEQINSIIPKITNENIKKFYARLVANRPLTFWNPGDDFFLKDGQRGQGCPGDQNPEDYVLYSEMELGSMLQVSGYTRFINDGGRYNKGELAGVSHEQHGRISAIAGARLEISDGMESMHCKRGVLDKVESQYKASVADAPDGLGDFGRIKSVKPEFVEGYKAIWSKFYEGYKTIGSEDVIDRLILEQRLYISYKKLFADAVANSVTPYTDKNYTNKKAYIRVVGLGDGAWSGGHDEDVRMAIGRSVRRVFDELTDEQKGKIAAIEFSQFNHEKYHKYFDPDGKLGSSSGGIDIISSQRAPFAHKLPDKYKDCQLCIDFAWDGGSYVGNEYWVGALTASGDPAAACCSSIAISMNPDYNPGFLGRVNIVTKQGTVEKLEYFSPTIDSQDTDLKHQEVGIIDSPQPSTPKPSRKHVDEGVVVSENVDYLISLYGKKNLVLMRDEEGQDNYLIRVGKNQKEAASKSEKFAQIGIVGGQGNKVPVPLDDDDKIIFNSESKYEYGSESSCALIFTDENVVQLREHFDQLEKERIRLAQVKSGYEEFLKRNSCKYVHLVDDEGKNNYLVYAGERKIKAKGYIEDMKNEGIYGKTLVPVDGNWNILGDKSVASIDHYALILNDADLKHLSSLGRMPIPISMDESQEKGSGTKKSVSFQDETQSSFKTSYVEDTRHKRHETRKFFAQPMDDTPFSFNQLTSFSISKTGGSTDKDLELESKAALEEVGNQLKLSKKEQLKVLCYAVIHEGFSRFCLQSGTSNAEEAEFLQKGKEFFALYQKKMGEKGIFSGNATDYKSPKFPEYHQVPFRTKRVPIQNLEELMSDLTKDGGVVDSGLDKLYKEALAKQNGGVKNVPSTVGVRVYPETSQDRLLDLDGSRAWG